MALMEAAAILPYLGGVVLRVVADVLHHGTQVFRSSSSRPWSSAILNTSCSTPACVVQVEQAGE